MRSIAGARSYYRGSVLISESRTRFTCPPSLGWGGRDGRGGTQRLANGDLREGEGEQSHQETGGRRRETDLQKERYGELPEPQTLHRPEPRLAALEPRLAALEPRLAALEPRLAARSGFLPILSDEMQTFLKGKRVGYWLSEKKIKKLNFQAFAELCRKRGIEVVQLDLARPIEDQGPLDVIIHKLTDVILEADQNDDESVQIVQRFQDYIEAHPETIILDPLPAIRTLLDRFKSYELIRRIESCMQDERICSPPFMELMAECGEDTLKLIEKNGPAFPFICKTRVAHGTNSHEMAIIFNAEGLREIRPPCVIQSFISHNAVLYKVFVVGDSYTVVERPSLKNFSPGESDRESIFFNSHNVSKPESSSVLTALDKVEGVFERPSDDVIRAISKALRQALGISLFGIDIIINNKTGQHAVIDINAFPGYEGVPEFFNDLLNHIAGILQRPEVNANKPEQTGSILGERLCCSPAPRIDPWVAENEANSAVKLQSQRLGCNSAMAAGFQQHCVASLATKASSQ